VSNLSLACVLAVAAPSTAQQATGAGTTITGTLLGADGRPMPLAHARLLYTLDGSAIATTAEGVGGSFSLSGIQPGAYYLDFGGVDHKRLRLPLVIDRETTIAVDVRLERYTWAADLDSVAAVGDWNRFNSSSARPLTKQPDGRYTLEIETAADTVAYQLLGLTANGDHAAGTGAARFAHDGRGNYRAVLDAQDGWATIVLDPRRLDRAPSAPRVAFRDRSSIHARAYEIFAASERWLAVAADSARAARKDKRKPTFDWTPAIGDLTNRLAREHDPVLRELILARILHWVIDDGARLDTALAARIVRELPPTSAWWTFENVAGPSGILTAMQQADDPHVRPQWPEGSPAELDRVLAYLDQVIARNTHPRARADAIAMAVAILMMKQDPNRANQYFDRLLPEYANVPLVLDIRAHFAPDRALRPGALVPEFRFAAVDDSTVVYTRDSMKGRVYLLDFWATWCGSCIQEMSHLHAAHQAFAPKGFEILSISLDNAREDVTRFRAGEWKMPWLHAFAPGGLGNPLVQPFGIIFVPRAALVDREGRIIAVDQDVRGSRLQQAVSDALK
jgi:thiol-disulfide isomerase/thioredoxin